MSVDRSNPDVRTRLIEATIRLLETEGPSEVKARSVTSEAGVSTMGVYTHFGGVPELLQAVAEEGLRRLVAAFESVPITDDPLADLCALSLACRDVARSNPHLYDLMFGLSIHGRYGPSRGPAMPMTNGHSPIFEDAYSHLLGACTRLVETKCIRKTEPSRVALQLWGAVHGFVMLELAGQFAGVADPPSEVLLPMCSNVIIGLGAERGKVESSTARVLAAWGCSTAPSSPKARKGGAKQS